MATIGSFSLSLNAVQVLKLSDDTQRFSRPDQGASERWPLLRSRNGGRAIRQIPPSRWAVWAWAGKIVENIATWSSASILLGLWQFRKRLGLTPGMMVLCPVPEPIR